MMLVVGSASHRLEQLQWYPNCWEYPIRRVPFGLFQLWVPDFVTVLVSWHQGLKAKDYSSSGKQSNVRPADPGSLLIGSICLYTLIWTCCREQSHSGRAPSRPGDAFSAADAMLKSIFARFCGLWSGNGQTACEGVEQGIYP